MTTEKFEKLKKECEEFKDEHIYTKAGLLIGKVIINEDLTREEILEPMELFLN